MNTQTPVQYFCRIQSLDSDHAGVQASGAVNQEYPYDLAYLTKDKANPVHLMRQGWTYLGKGYTTRSVRAADGMEFPVANPEQGNTCYFWKKPA